MLIHNKRLHPRRPCEPGEHLHGCMLHEMEEQRSNARNSASPTLSRSRTPSSQYSSLSSLNQRRNQTSSRSTTNLSSSPINWRTPSSSSSSPTKRYSIGAYPQPNDIIQQLFIDVVDSPIKSSLRSKSVGDQTRKEKAKSTICLNSTLSHGCDNGKLDKRGQHTVTFKCYDSPDQIIANLFPGIDERETKFLRKGHGAAQMARNRSTTPSMQRDWSNYVRSTSATDNYTTPNCDNRKLRSFSTSSDNSCAKRSYTMAGRLFSVERDFDHLWWVLYACVCVYVCYSHKIHHRIHIHHLIISVTFFFVILTNSIFFFGEREET